MKWSFRKEWEKNQKLEKSIVCTFEMFLFDTKKREYIYSTWVITIKKTRYFIMGSRVRYINHHLRWVFMPEKLVEQPFWGRDSII